MAPPPYPPYSDLFGLVLPRSLVVTHMSLAGDPSSFNAGLFRSRICTNGLFDVSCSTSQMTRISAVAGSTVVSFTIKFVNGGPTISHMRSRLVQPELVQQALGADFTLAYPYEVRMYEDVQHRSNDDLMFELGAIKLSSAGTLVQVLCMLWGTVVFWSITSRGESCRQQAHNSWAAALIPSSESIQVFVLASFVELILCLGLHMAGPTGSFDYVVMYGFGVGAIGAAFISLSNAWIRGTNIDLLNALSVDQIDKEALGWNDDEPIEGETEEEAEAARVEYRQVYEVGGDRRALGHLAAHDWEQYHKSLEERMGLGMFDLSNQVFDQVKPEKDPGMLAAFLNSTVMGLFGGAKDGEVAAPPPVREELQLVPVEVPIGLPKATLRDALLQWRLRHTAHPVEAEAVDWVLGQMEPAGFELVAVKVPEQLRLLLTEALIAHSQQHAELQMDACHAMRLRATLQQLSNRFTDLEVAVPDAAPNELGDVTAKTRGLLHDAIKARLTNTSKRDASLEEGLMLQQVLQGLTPEFGLIAMDHPTKEAEQKHMADDERALAVKAEIEKRADEVRAANADYMYDDELFTPVPTIMRTKPVDAVEVIAVERHSHPLRKGAKTAAAKAPSSTATSATVALAAASSATVSSATASSTASSAAAMAGFAMNAAPQLDAITEGSEGRPSAAPTAPAGAAASPPPPKEAEPYLGDLPEPDLEPALPAPPSPTASPPPSPPPSPPSPPAEPSEPELEAPSFREALSLQALPLPEAPPEPEPEVASEGFADEPDKPPPLSEALNAESVAQFYELGREESDYHRRLRPARPKRRWIPTFFRGLLDGTKKDAVEKPHDVDVELAPEQVARQEELRHATLSKRTKFWWRQRQKASEADHERMPCWKQYFVLFVGSCIVAACTITVITLFAIIPPLAQYFVMFSFSGALPFSFVLHFSLRFLLRELRKYAALYRGRHVEGKFRKTRAPPPPRPPGERKRKLSVSFAPPAELFGLKAAAPAGEPEASGKAPGVAPAAAPGVAPAAAPAGTPGAAPKPKPKPKPPIQMRWQASAFIDSRVLDETQTLAERKIDNFAQSAAKQAEASEERKRTSYVMSKANQFLGGQVRAGFSTFLDQPGATASTDAASEASGGSDLREGSVPRFGPGFDFEPDKRAFSKGAAAQRGHKLVAQAGRLSHREPEHEVPAAAPGVAQDADGSVQFL